MYDERGNIVNVGPSTRYLLGLDGAATAGDKFNVFEDEKKKQIASKRSQLMREQSVRTQRHITLDEIGRRIALGQFKELNVILKGDVDGSVEALSDSSKLSTEEIQINIT
jgi:translation initiation factor IF-2